MFWWLKNNLKSLLIYSTTYDTILSGGEQKVGVEKIVNKMRRQPNSIRFNEATKVLNK